MDFQVFITTHSPLVLASLESDFDTESDSIFTISQTEKSVNIEKEIWTKRGDVVNWLTSDSFGLTQARSIQAEKAIEAAERYMRGQVSESSQSKEEIHEALLRSLPGNDHFWPRWILSLEASNPKKP